MVSGFSGSSPTNYIGAFYAWRLSSGATLVQPRLIQPGLTNYTFKFWGDYSATTSDPLDDWSFWTVQEYASPFQVNTNRSVGDWGTVIVKLKPNP